MSLSTIRHDDIFPAHKHNDPIHLIGCGAIGSRVWEGLVNLGLTNLTCYDFDQVEPHNLANQLYFDHDIGSNKTEALRHWTARKLSYVPDSMNFHNIKVESGNQEIAPIIKHTVILAVDSIAARRDIIEYITASENPQTVYHILDTRMASTHGNVVYLNPNNPIALKAYLDALPTDEDSEVSSCGTSLSVGTTASLIANLAVWQLMHLRHTPELLEDDIEIYFKPLMLMQRQRKAA